MSLSSFMFASCWRESRSLVKPNGEIVMPRSAVAAERLFDWKTRNGIDSSVVFEVDLRAFRSATRTQFVGEMEPARIRSSVVSC